MQKGKRKTPDFYDGDVIRRCAVAGLEVVEQHYPAGFERALHAHAHACFHFPFQGGYTESQQKRSREIRPFTLSFQPAGHEHAYRCFDEEVMQTLSLEVESAWLMCLRDYPVYLDQPGNFHSPQIQWLIARLRRELAMMEPTSPLVMEALALELAVEVSRRQFNPPEQQWPRWLSRAKEFLHANYRQPLSLRDVAQAAAVHPVHLARTFRQHFHCTVGAYVRQLRIEFACRQISQADASLLDIAVTAGFYDQSQFTRTFKRVVGVTPAEFRAGLRAR